MHGVLKPGLLRVFTWTPYDW